MMIRAHSPLPIGARVSVEPKQADPVIALGQRVEDGLTGVVFDAPIDVLALLAPPGDGARPRLPRIEIECTAWVRQESELIRTRLVNVSQGGVRIQCSAGLIVGGEAVVTLPGL